MRAAASGSTFSGRHGTTFVVGVLFAAILLGALTVLAGSSSSVVLGAGIIATIGLGGLIALTLEMPVIIAVRFGFIASFFIKTDFTLVKIDEIEDPSGFNLSIALLFALILLAHDLLFEERSINILPRYFWFLLVGLAIFSMASVIMGGSEVLGWASLFSLGGSILITIAVASHFSNRDRAIDLSIGIACGIAFTGIAAISQFLVDFPRNLPFLGTGTEEEALGTQSEELGRVPAFLRTPTGMAFVITTLLPVALTPVVFRIREIVSWQRLLFVSATILGTAAVILSLARGSWIALSVGLAVPLIAADYWIPRNQRGSYIATASAGLVLSCVLLLPLAPRIYERLTADDEGSASIRIPLMETAIELIRENPIAGVGLNGYRSNMTKYDETGMFVSQAFPNPVHNVFAHVTAEVGIPGGIIFCLLIIAAIYECLLSLRSDDKLLTALAMGAGIGLVAFIISAMKEPGSLGSARPPIRTLFLMLGVVMALARIRRYQA